MANAPGGAGAAPLQMAAADFQALLQAVGPRTGRKPPTYSSGDGGEWIVFRRTFTLTAQANGWNDQAAVFQLGAALEGQASRMASDIDPLVDANGDPRTLQGLLGVYEARFLPPAASRLSLASFNQARQTSSENAMAWSSRLRELFVRARPNADPENNDELINKFVMGLYDGKVKAKVFDDAPASLTAATNSASNKEANLAIMGKSRGGGSVSALSGANGVDSSEDSSSDEDEDESISAARRRRLRCFQCNKSGHFRRDCPDLKPKKGHKSKKGAASKKNPRRSTTSSTRPRSSSSGGRPSTSSGRSTLRGKQTKAPKKSGYRGRLSALEEAFGSMMAALEEDKGSSSTSGHINPLALGGAGN